MAQMNHSAIEAEIAQLIVDTLNLEEIEADEIDPNQPLFREGLGLDSIDALELGLALSQQYGCQLQSDAVENGQIFASLRALSAYVERHRRK
jgi:acyl carrier protein